MFGSSRAPGVSRGWGGVVGMFLAVWVACLSGPVLAQVVKGKAKSAGAAAPLTASARTGDPLAGARKSDEERCQECHGADGHGFGQSASSEGRHPKLAGQSADYIVKQIADFRSGARKHDVMTLMARTVEPADILDIAAYFASRSPMKGEGAAVNPLGRRLYESGDAARGIEPCIACHGPAGEGVAGLGAAAPRVGGQEWRYLEKQLLDWRSGERRNSRDGVMNRVTRGLSDEELRALADYLAVQP